MEQAVNESKPCENCQDHSVRIARLETGAEWMESALDEIRGYTKEVAGYAHQLADVAHKTAAMSDAVGRAFDEIEKEREERRHDLAMIQRDLSPIVKGWGGVVETSLWVKTAVVAIVGLVFAALLGLVLI